MRLDSEMDSEMMEILYIRWDSLSAELISEDTCD